MSYIRRPAAAAAPCVGKKKTHLMAQNSVDAFRGGSGGGFEEAADP